MQHKTPSSQWVMLLPTPVGLLGISKVVYWMRSFHFTFRMKIFFFPPHYHYDILYNSKSL